MSTLFETGSLCWFCATHIRGFSCLNLLSPQRNTGISDAYFISLVFLWVFGDSNSSPHSCPACISVHQLVTQNSETELLNHTSASAHKSTAS